MAVPGTRHKSFGLVKSARPEEGKAKVYTFKLSDGEFDRYNDRLRVDGWKLDAFNANPVIFYNHDSGTSWWGDRKSLPIGKGHAYKSGPDLLLDVEFDQNDEFAKKVESKVDGGFLNAVSVGYRMTKFHENDRGGYDSDEHDLLEASVVTIPGNERALRVRGLADDTEFIDLLGAAIARATKQASTSERPARDTHAVQGAKMTPEEIKAAIEAAAKKAAEAATAAAMVESQKAIDAVKAQVVESAKGTREVAPIAPAEVKSERAPVTGEAVVLKTPGMLAARFIQAKALAKLEERPVREVIKSQGDEVLTKALAQNDFTGFGSTVHEVIAQDFIELRRNSSVVRQAGPRQVSLKGGSLKFDRQTGAASASYGAEGTDIRAGATPTTDQITMSEKKLTGLVPISNDLLRNSSVGAQEMIRADLGRVVGLTEDSAFLFGSGTANTPQGLYFQLAAAMKYAMAAITTAGAPTVGEAKKEFNKALKKLKAANVPLTKFAWLFNPYVESAILDALGPGGEGANQLEREMTERGTVRSKPYLVTNQIPNTLQANLATGGTKTAIMGFDFDDVIIADWLDLELEVFLNGTYVDANGNVVSGVSRDQTVIRAISKHDIAMRHRESGIAIYDTTWGV